MVFSAYADFSQRRGKYYTLHQGVTSDHPLESIIPSPSEKRLRQSARALMQSHFFSLCPERFDGNLPAFSLVPRVSRCPPSSSCGFYDYISFVLTRNVASEFNTVLLKTQAFPRTRSYRGQSCSPVALTYMWLNRWLIH